MKRLVITMLVIIVILLPHNKIVYADDIVNSKSNIHRVFNEGEVSPDYVFALNATNRFLNAWLMRSYQDGMNCVSENLKSTVAESELIAFFTGTSKPQHLAYEVVGWKYVDENTIKFHVWLYEYIEGESSNPINHLEPFYIEVVRVQKDKWLVNTLPMRENYYHGADNV